MPAAARASRAIEALGCVEKADRSWVGGSTEPVRLRMVDVQQNGNIVGMGVGGRVKRGRGVLVEPVIVGTYGWMRETNVKSPVIGTGRDETGTGRHEIRTRLHYSMLQILHTTVLTARLHGSSMRLRSAPSSRSRRMHARTHASRLSLWRAIAREPS